MKKKFIIFVLLFSFVTLFFNVSNDFQENLKYNFFDLSKNLSIAYKGWFYFKTIAFLSKIFSTQFVVYFLYLIVPALLSALSLKSFKITLAFLFYFFSIVICGQSTYLLKMALSQIIILVFLFNRKFALISISSILIHIQAFPIISFFFYKIKRTYYIFFLLLGIYLIYKIGFWPIENDLFLAYGGAGDEIIDYNKITVVLLLIYLLTSFFIKNDQKKIILLKKLIDTIIISSLLFLNNAIIFNRILEYSWLFILIFVFIVFQKFNIVVRSTVHIGLLCCSIMALIFFLNNIIGFTL